MTSEMEYLREAVEELTKHAKRAEADRDEWRMKAKVNAEAADRLGRMLEETEAEREALANADPESPDSPGWVQP